MIDPKIVNAVHKGKTAYDIMERFNVSQATAFRLVKRIRSGQLERKSGSGQLQGYVWDTEAVRRFLLNGPPISMKVDGHLWTVQNIRESIKSTLNLNISLDTIRRRLNRSGLRPRFPNTVQRKLANQNTPVGRRVVCLFIGQAEIDLHALATNLRSTDKNTLNIIYVLDRRNKLRFQCSRRQITSNDLIAFFNELLDCYNNCFVVCSVRLPLTSAVQRLLNKRQHDIGVICF